MSLARRSWLLALTAAAFLSACAVPGRPSAPAATAAERQLLAPTGKLRVGVYLGSPTSLVRGANGEARGVSVEVGQALARDLGVPYEQVEFPRLASVLDALKAGQVDFAVTNASPARAVDMNFTTPLVQLELGYLVLPGSRIGAIADVDQPGMKIGVSQGSTSQGVLTRTFKQAQVVPAPSLKAAGEMLTDRRLDAFATNKGILFELADGLPGARVLPGNWGLEQLAIAVPKGREGGMDYMRRFAQQVRADGSVQRAAERAGLRGTLPAP